MSNRRDTVLGLLGVERWQLRDAGPAEQASPQPVLPPTTIERPAGARPVVSQPLVSAEVAAPMSTEFEVSSDWQGLRAQVADCTRCKLCKTRTQTVFGVGGHSASLMVVGEGPGADEDATGEPFVGRAGKLLDEMLKSIGRSRQETATASANGVYIANVVKCRPPGNRDPEKEEVAACRHYLDGQIALLKPKLIVALGRIAAQRLLSSDEPLSRLRGPLHQYGPSQTPVFVTYHPAYLLRAPREKAKSWEDLKKIAQHLKVHG